MLDRVLAGEPVDATEDVLVLAELAEEVESVFTAVQPTSAGVRRGMNLALEAFAASAPRRVVPTATRRIAARALVAAAMVVALPSLGWAASENAMPGDLLYPVKRAFEQIRLVTAFSPTDEAAIRLDMAAERLGEAVWARALGLDEEVRTAIAGYSEAMAGFERSVAEARAAGDDLSGLLAVAEELVQRHQQLLDALLGNGTPAGTSPLVADAPGNAKGTGQDGPPGAEQPKGKGKAQGEGGGNGREQASEGRAEGRKHGKDRENRQDAEQADAVIPPEAADGPGRAESAPHGKAEGHQKHGPPPQGNARGHGENADPPPH